MADKHARIPQTAPDLNDLFLFAQVVSHGGFSSASRSLGIPKSRVSRRIASLEERLGARLVQRSTRTFAITAAGQLFLQHCQRIVAEARAAEAAVMEIQKTPRGMVRISCPITMAQSMLGQLLPRYLIDNPEVTVEVTSTSRSLNLIERAIDIAIVIHKDQLPDSSLVVRSLGVSRQVLVASPRLFERVPRPASPDDLQRCPMLCPGHEWGGDRWVLTRDHGEQATVVVDPRLESESLLILKTAAVAGVGIVRLPKIICVGELRTGELELVLPQWSVASHEIHAVCPSRKGMSPAVRSLLDFLVKQVPQILAQI